MARLRGYITNLGDVKRPTAAQSSKLVRYVTRLSDYAGRNARIADPSAIQPAPVSGSGTWYCRPGVSRCTRGYPGGMFAAVRRDLLYLRGTRVAACVPNSSTAPARCVIVKVIDCNCGPAAGPIDLYSDAFQMLAPLSRGRIKVTIIPIDRSPIRDP